ncbi:amino acid adenylation domain-containing protein, partial [Pseudoalteromonas sp. JBTF-M23]
YAFASVLGMIEQQAVQQPQAEALQTAGVSVCYADVLQQAKRVAAGLQQQGIGPGDRVAVLMNRNQALPVTLLAVLLSGAAYVPLDPSYPAERLNYIIDDCLPAFILHDDNAAMAALSYGCVSQSVASYLEQDSAPDFRAVEIEAASLAYIIYTSGSTGKPKGVAIAHDGLMSLFHWAKQQYCPEDFALVFAGTSVCFDLSVFEIFVTWGMGGSIYFADNSLYLSEIGNRYPITLINTVPSILASILEVSVLPESVRVINLAGEAFPVSMVEKLGHLAERVRVFNLYGPSEDTTYSTAYQINFQEKVSVPIGKVLPGTSAFVMDAQGRELPDNFPGELYLSGRGLALGYWGNERLTAQQFVVPTGMNRRCYKTGDLVRRRSDGNLEFLSRVDNLIKIRGFRVEPEEISTVIKQVSAEVEQAVVIDVEH